MGDTSIIARRLKNGHVQYGWFDTHSPTGKPFSEFNTEREIFMEDFLKKAKKQSISNS